MHKEVNLTSLGGKKFQGYLWYSDAEAPVLLEQETVKDEHFTKLPFIIEGNLYCEAERLSVQIKNIDGVYKITSVVLPQPQHPNYFLESYIAHDVKGYRKFLLFEAWEAETDDLLSGMGCLQPAWSAFAGFEK